MEQDEYNDMVQAFKEIMHDVCYAMTVKDRTAVIDGNIVDCEELDVNEMAEDLSFVKDETPKTPHSESIKEFMSRDMDISKEMELLDRAFNGNRSQEIWKEMGYEETSNSPS